MCWLFVSLRRRRFGPHHSLLVSDGPGINIFRDSRGTWGKRRGYHGSHDVWKTPQRGNGGLLVDVGVLHCHGIRGSTLALDSIVCSAFLTPPF
jgi:hypothetical protein